MENILSEAMKAIGRNLDRSKKFVKVKHCINSCENSKQVLTCLNIIKILQRRNHDQSEVNELSFMILRKSREIAQKSKVSTFFNLAS